MARSRITFQSQALYVGSGQSGANGDADLVPTEIQKTQLVNIDSDVNREPVNEFGRLAALGYTSPHSPIGLLRTRYFLGKGENEHALGFSVDGTKNFLNISGIKKNFYLLTVSEKKDAVQAANYTEAEREKHSVVALGNGMLTNYQVEAEVGAIPSTTLDYEGANILFVTGSSGIPNPAVNTSTMCLRSGVVTIPAASTGTANTPVLRPEDITLDFGPSLLAEGGPVLPGNTAPSLQEVYISEFNINASLDLEEEESLGGGPKKEFEVPVDIQFNCRALLTDVHSGNLINEVCSPTPRDITINLKPPCLGCSGANTNDPSMKFIIKGAVFEGQSIVSTLDEEAMIDLRFTTQLGAQTQTDKGLIISGSYIP
tara:strand:+ start:4180 stop:5292 length:1113 start_codon:yes stop_codon:yes gene_type:complete